jgi:hypothetical protein
MSRMRDVNCTHKILTDKSENKKPTLKSDVCMTCIVIYFYSKTNQMHNILNLFYFGNKTLHVSDGLSVQYQESKAVHTASGICRTDISDCLLAGTRWNSFHLGPPSKQPQNLYDKYPMSR